MPNVAVKELSLIQVTRVEAMAGVVFCNKFDVLQIIGLTGPQKGAETPTDTGESVVPYALFCG